MNNKKLIVIHIICWILFLGYFFLGTIIEGHYDENAYFGYSISFVQIVEFYVCFLWVYPRFLNRYKFPQLIAGILVAMAVFIGLRYFIEEVLFPHFLGMRNYDPETTISHYIKDNIYYGTKYIVVSAAIWSTQHAFKTERDNKQLKAEAMKAELSFLKSQINPHFLYNTLNYIYALAIPVSDQLSSAVMRLSDLMRYTLTDNPDGKVSLVKEIEYLESYVELFRMRFTPNFFVEFKTEGVNEQHRIASLLLIPFIENAFKHGVVNNSQYPVQIVVAVHNKELYFEVSNQINNHQKDRSSGIGLVNIHRRLDLIYPSKHVLDITKNEDAYKTVLTIKL
ncbi:sensor histidine kinase [Pedobacter sp. PWIIR3]